MSKELKFYAYARCSTCRNAKQWLEANHLPFREIPIREQPPDSTELRVMIRAYDNQMKKILNTSSQDYRESGLKDQIPGISEDTLVEKLRQNGNLIKRPFLIGPGIAWVGFKEDIWKSALKNSD